VESIFPGPNLQGYDIGCSFEKTVGKADLFNKLELQQPCEYTLPALHGYGHNRLCQLRYQLLYCAGAGLSDFEQCERFFSALNAVALLTRHATSFHRHQFLDLQVRQWNREKLTNLGKFIFDHYHKALNILRSELPKLREAERSQGYDSSTYLDWTQQELDYLLSIKREPPEDTERCLYVKRLQDLWKAE
jgi:hypothetical protein